MGPEFFKNLEFCSHIFALNFEALFTELRKTPFRFVRVCLSLRPHGGISIPTGRIFIKSNIPTFLKNLLRKFNFHENRTRITRTVATWIAVYIYDIYRGCQTTYIQGVPGRCARLREGVPYVKVYRYNPKHLCPKLNGYGDNGQRSLKLWRLLHTYLLPNTY